MTHDRYSDATIRAILREVRTVAIIGASANEVRPSFFVTKYLIAKGYRVFPVNPGLAGKQIAGRPTYASLADIPEAIDMVDIFRAPEHVPPIVDEAIRLNAKVIWMQLGVRHDAAAAKAEAAGLQVVMDRCPKIEYGRLCGEISWAGVNSRRISAKRPTAGAGVQQLTIGPAVHAVAAAGASSEAPADTAAEKPNAAQNE
ncbi:MAG: CoA-binding protein [Ancalomicrobiaceae bacterium]|nr:CoA-binding protein [Ancalomicrobiaceae bacterium]